MEIKNPYLLRFSQIKQAEINSLKKRWKSELFADGKLNESEAIRIWEEIQNYSKHSNSDNERQTILLCFGIICIFDNEYGINTKLFSEICDSQQINAFFTSFKYKKSKITNMSNERFNRWAQIFNLDKRSFVFYKKDMPPPEGEYTEVAQIYPLLGGVTWTNNRIMLAISHSDLKPVVIKKVNIKTAGAYFDKSKDRQNCILSKVIHPSILVKLDSGWMDDYYVFVNEFCAFGNIEEEIERRRPTNSLFSNDQMLLYGYQLITALKQMHDFGFIHRDIKPSNLFMRTERMIVLGDFEFARPLNTKETSTNVGTYMYVSPEMIRTGIPGNEVTTKADIYSFAMTMYTMRTLREPFPDRDYSSVIESIKSGERPVFTNPQDPINQLIMNCWSDDPKSRLDADQVIETIGQIWDSLHGDISIDDVIGEIYSEAPSESEEGVDREWELFFEASNSRNKAKGNWEKLKIELESDKFSPEIAVRVKEYVDKYDADDDPLF